MPLAEVQAHLLLITPALGPRAFTHAIPQRFNSTGPTVRGTRTALCCTSKPFSCTRGSFSWTNMRQSWST